MKAIESTETHPNEGKCKTKVSHKSSAFRAELTEKNRSIVMACVTTVHDEARSVGGQSQAGARPVSLAIPGRFSAWLTETLWRASQRQACQK